MIYSLIFKLALRRIDPERAHALAGWALRLLAILTPLRAALERLTEPDPSLRMNVLGLDFASPLGVAAGLDKQASAFAGLGALGFGFVEIGTVTALEQPGNPRPRVFRLTGDRALINRMGFPNPGAVRVAARLRARGRSRLIVGANVGKSKLTPLEQAQEDYRSSVRALGDVCDYLVVNVSSPNTPGLRELQKTEALRAIVGAAREELEKLGRSVPLLVKIAPDLSDDQIDEIADLALELKLDGIVAVNTTLARDSLVNCREQALAIEGGGLSGAPLQRRAVSVLRRLDLRVQGRIALVSVGGIETAQDVWERLLAGASLVQAYTAFVYRGPGWPSRVQRELARIVRANGLDSIEQAIGMDAGRAAGKLSSGAGKHP